jgi:hypothetical protein
VTTFPTASRARLRACQASNLGLALSMGADHRSGSEGDEREARRRGRGWKGAPAAAGRQPGPLPLARRRTGAGHCRNAVSPAPARLAVPAVTHPRWPHLQEQPGGPPAPGILSPRKDQSQGRTSSLRCGRSTLTLIFHGKIRRLSGRTAQCRDSQLVRTITRRGVGGLGRGVDGSGRLTGSMGSFTYG